MSAERRYIYAQTAIGSCGHQINGWPAIYRLGEKLPLVPCDECTAASVPDADGNQVGIWVRAVEPAKRIVAKGVKRKSKSSSQSTKVVKKRPAWKVLLDGD